MAYYSDHIQSAPLTVPPVKWSVRRTILFVLTANLGLWTGLIWATAKLAAHL